MTGYQSKRAAAQDKLAQPAQEPVAVQKSGIANSPSDPEICNERSAQACGPVYCGDSGGYCNKCPKQKTIQTVKACKGMNCGCTDGRSHSLECLAELAAAIAGGVFVQEALAQPEQEPVAWIEKDMQCDDFDSDSVTCEKPARAADGWEWIPLYTTPPQRPWVSLTDDQIKEIVGPWGDTPIKGYTRELIDKIDAKLRENNT
jgi:hypothetical protein